MKKLIGLTIIAVIILLSVWNRFNNQQKVKLSQLTLNNIEALASGENLDSGSCYYYGCRYSLDYKCSVYTPWGVLIGHCDYHRG